jgi:hypothetical protein
MGIFAGPGVIEDGLVLALDAANLKGYDKYENLLRYSEEFDNGVWQKQNGFSITPNTAIAPDGTLTADTASRVNLSAEYLYQAYGGAGTFTLSCWVRAVTGTTTFVMSAYNGVDSITGSQTFTATTTWQRFSYTATVSVATNWYPCIPSVSGAQLYIWGAQVERGSSVTDYYSTTSSAKTRGTTWTDLSLGGGNNGTLVNGPTYDSSNGGSISFDDVNDYVRFSRTDLNAGSFAYTNITCNLWVNPGSSQNTTASTLNNLITVENTFEISIGNRSNGFSSLFYASVPWAWYGTESDVLKNDAWNMITFVHATTGRWLYVNGTQVFYRGDTGNLTAGNSSYPYLTLMGRTDGTGSPAGGLLSNVQLYNRALTATEIQKNFNAQRGRFGI